jgi:hypothetical protein
MIEKGTILVWKKNDKNYNARKGDMVRVTKDCVGDTFIHVEFLNNSTQQNGGYVIDNFYTISEYREEKLKELGIV